MRRIGTGVAASLLVALAVSSGGCSGGQGESLTSLVDPFIGTGGHGHTYPGATLPFGMIQVSPDTRLEGWDGCSGYHYSDEHVYGFSHTHLSGTGIADYCDILFMPTVDEIRYHNGADGEPGYRSRFRHEREEASPGYYRTFLDDYNIGVELTAARRAAIHRYTFPEAEQANVIIDLAHRDQVIESWITFVGEDEIEGYRRSRSWAQDQRVYFVARFSRPFDRSGVLVDGLRLDGVSQAYGTDLKASVTFDTAEDEVILVKVGISAVDIEGARKNLEAEIPDWDFAGVRAGADRVWESELGRIVVEGGTREQRTVFYTALYHAMLAPNVYQDVDGRYLGRDFEVHLAEGFTNHTVFSLWDTFRAAHPLFALIQQARTVDFINTFLTQYEQGGLPPVWELSANETNTMIGYHAIPVIADAWMKGIRDFDITKAFEAMTAAASTDHEGLAHYRELGYIPGDEESESVSRTLEYSYDDWCIAAIADEIDRPDVYREFTDRAHFYRNVYDPSTGFMRAKLDGHWQPDFDPREVNFHYTEANSWQYSFFAPHDIEGLIDLMDGRVPFVERLDGLFTADSETTGRRQSDITGLVGQYAHGNEPSHHMAYLYSYAGEPWKTQERVRESLDTLYSADPDGLSGNEDCGQMSAWFVLSALGFYPVCPGQPEYVIGTPLFPKATIHLENGNHFTIRAEGAGRNSFYVQSAALNDAPYTQSWLTHDAIMHGGELTFEMGRTPNPEWGTGEGDLPRSPMEDTPFTAVPFLVSGERTFRDSTEIALGVVGDDTAIHFTLDGSEPDSSSPRYAQPFTVSETTTIRMIACGAGGLTSRVSKATVFLLPEDVTINLNTRYSDQYPAGGDTALIDQIRGSDNFRTGTWQGYYGVDLEAVVDLGSVKVLTEVRTGFLQEQRSWIWMPSEVEYATSTDGESWRVAGTVVNDVPERRDGGVVKDFIFDLGGVEARFVRVRATNRGPCPDWHQGAGNRSWMFADEIVIRER